MKRTAIWAILMAITVSACAQQNPTAVKYSKLITPEFAKQQLSIIASDDMEGRETGKPGAEKAAKYLAEQYQKLGLLPANKGSYFVNVPLAQRVYSAKRFSINGTFYNYGTDFYYTTTWSEPASVSDGSVVFIGYGTPDELKTDIYGKIVMMIGDEKPGTVTRGRRRGLSAEKLKIMADIRSHQPSMILSVSAGTAAAIERMNKEGSRLSIADESREGAVRASDFPPAATFYITPQMADMILRYTRKTYAGLKADVDNGTVQTQKISANIDVDYSSAMQAVHAVDIVAMIPGSDPKLKDEVLVFSAHYDHIGLNADGPDKVNNGADDDGSGTTGILAIARAFAQAKKDGHSPRRTILFLGNVGEEKGLLGSEYYTDHPVFPLEKTIANLNIDMIGRVGEEYKKSPDSANYVYPIGSAMLSSTLHKIGEAANNTYTHLKLDYKYDDITDPNRFYYRSDHYNFAKHGVPIIFYFNGVHEDYHRPGDEVSKINFPLLAKRAQLVFFTGWELANRDERPVVDSKTPAPVDK